VDFVPPAVAAGVFVSVSMSELADLDLEHRSGSPHAPTLSGMNASMFQDILASYTTV
jgi:hypothetical protein